MQATAITVKAASKMSSSAIRLITNDRPSTVMNSPAMAPTRVERDNRRAIRMVAITSSVPKTTEAMRQPKLFMPKTYSPDAISHLPSCGWTMNDGASVKISVTPATIWSLASFGQLPS